MTRAQLAATYTADYTADYSDLCREAERQFEEGEIDAAEYDSMKAELAEIEGEWRAAGAA